MVHFATVTPGSLIGIFSRQLPTSLRWLFCRSGNDVSLCHACSPCGRGVHHAVFTTFVLGTVIAFAWDHLKDGLFCVRTEGFWDQLSESHYIEGAGLHAPVFILSVTLLVAACQSACTRDPFTVHICRQH